MVKSTLVGLQPDRIRDLIARLEFVRDEAQRNALIRELRSEWNEAERRVRAIERQRD